MKKRTHIFDVDDVIIPDRWFVALNEYLAKLGKPTYENHDSFKTFHYIKDVFPDEKERRKFYKFFYSYDTYKDMKPIEGAVEGLRKLGEDKGNRIRLATSCFPADSGNRENLREFKDKMNWIIDNLPFYDYKETIAIFNKDNLHGFSMTDDKLSNLSGSFKRKIMFPAWHNTEVTQKELADTGAVKLISWGGILECLK